MEGDSKALAEKHALEHAESLNVPSKKMGVDVITKVAKVSSVLKVAEPECQFLLTGGPCTCGQLKGVATPTKGIGGAPTRPFTMPETAEERKKTPIASGVLDYFPDAIVALAQLSWQGNEQHNPGQSLHWDREKSTDEADTMLRHFMQPRPHG
jgi:hypothetical protein